MIRIELATTPALWHIAQHMRKADRVELAAMSDDERSMDQSIVVRVMRYSLHAFTAYDPYRGPVAAWGVMPLWPGVGNAFAFGTDDWGRALLPMTRHIRGVMIPHLLDNGFHRVECRSLASRKDSSRWLQLLGAEQEAVMRGSGARGQDFILYRWLANEHRCRALPDQHHPRAQAAAAQAAACHGR